jgi:Flp pilus assembly protein TadG
MSPPMRDAARRQRGIAAVELALIMPVFLIMLALPLYFGRVFWHYTVAQKAAHDAARYLSTVPLADLKNPGKIAHVMAVAQDIAEAEMAELNPGPYRPNVGVLCDGYPCAGVFAPTKVTVVIQMSMADPIFADITFSLLGGGVGLLADSTFPTSKN